MRCRFCGGSAGFRRCCRDCRRLWKIWQRNRGRSMPELLKRFAETGIDRTAIEHFLRAEPKRGSGSVLDQMAADVTNELLGGLGQGSRQDGALVKRLRERGLWRRYDERPSGDGF